MSKIVDEIDPVSLSTDFAFQVDCANGQTGFGKRRRDTSDAKTSTKNKVYEVSMSTVVRVGEEKVEKSTESRREKDTLVVEEGKSLFCFIFSSK